MKTASDQVQEALCSIFALLNNGSWAVKKLNDFKCNVQSSEQCTIERSGLFWKIIQHSMVVVTDVIGQPNSSIFKGPIGFFRNVRIKPPFYAA
jgi:hypothetical protein